MKCYLAYVYSLSMVFSVRFVSLFNPLREIILCHVLKIPMLFGHARWHSTIYQPHVIIVCKGNCQTGIIEELILTFLILLFFIFINVYCGSMLFPFYFLVSNIMEILLEISIFLTTMTLYLSQLFLLLGGRRSLSWIFVWRSKFLLSFFLEMSSKGLIFLILQISHH